MGSELSSRIDGLTQDQIERYASILAHRAGLVEDLAGHESVDFIHEAIRKVLAGERALRPGQSLEENLVSIARSLVWNERKKLGRAPSRTNVLSPPEADRSPPDLGARLHTALGKAQELIEGITKPCRSVRDAARVRTQVEG